ncbi:MAG TPA: hypothetical protein VGE19_15645 [Pseudoxanthomonas sp.]|jgi:hypothetical protein
MNEALLPPDPCSPCAGWIRESFDAAGARLDCPAGEDGSKNEDAPCF